MLRRHFRCVFVGFHSCRIGRVAVALLFGVAGGSMPLARADSVNSPNITLNVDANRAGGPGAGNASVVVNTITVAETMLPEYSSGAGKSISLRARPGYQFDAASPVTVQSATIGFNGQAVNAVTTVAPTGIADEVLTFNLTSGADAGAQDIIRINGVRVRIISAVGAAGPAQATIGLSTSAAGGAFTNQGIVAATITRGAADRLQFVVQPGANQAGAALLPTVRIVDFGGNVVTNDPRNITLALQANPGAATLLGQTQRTTVNGLATWVAADELRITTAAAGYTLRASHGGANFLSSDIEDSAPFEISAAAPNRLVITRQPAATAAGADILFDVTIQDGFGNTVISPGVDVSIEAATNPGGWPLLAASSLTKTTVNGVASWADADDLRINRAVTGYRLLASGAGAPVFSDPFDITPADPAALRFVQQPSDVGAGDAVAPPVSVEIVDAFNNRTTSTATVDLALTGAACGGVVAGGSATAVAGLATFPTLQLDTACNTTALEASSSNLARATSNPFRVIAPPSANAGLCGLCGGGMMLSVVPIALFQLGLRRRLRARRRSPRRGHAVANRRPIDHVSP